MKTAIPSLLYITLLLSSAAYAEVMTDGTVGMPGKFGNPQHLSGQMVIPQNLGTTVGNNLFHSFKTFNIQTGESATFTGGATLKNVISRVTGGNPSTLNGLLKSQIGKANFYFINPAGVMFGKNAVVDVPAAFHVSTAQALRFSDRSLFNAIPDTASSLSIADPVGFGFLNNQAGDIQVQGSALKFKDGSSVSISGNNLILNNGKLLSSAGKIQLYATGAEAAEINLKTPAIKALTGKLILDNGSSIDTSGNGAGEVLMRSGILNLHHDSSIYANNNSILNAGTDKGIDIITHEMKVNHSMIAADSYDKGNAGIINLDISKNLTLRNGGTISSSTTGAGNAGDIFVTAQTLTLDNGSIIALAEQNSSGNAGTVKLQSGILDILNGAKVSSSTLSTGNAGNVTITASHWLHLVDGVISIENDAVLPETHIVRTTPSTITVTAPDIDMKNSEITSHSSANVVAGNININFSHWLTMARSFISTTANTGNGGDISINGGQLIHLQNSGFLTSVSGITSHGGDIDVTVNTLLMDTGVIQANAVSRSDGDIDLNLQTLTPSGNKLQLGGSEPIDWEPDVFANNLIQAASPDGISGNIKVSAPQMNITADISGLDSSKLVISTFVKNPCRDSDTVISSSLARASKGGLPFNEIGDNNFIPPIIPGMKADLAGAFNTEHVATSPVKSDNHSACSSVFSTLPLN